MIYRFGPFELDLARVELRALGRPHSLEPQVFTLLTCLLDSRERVVSHDELIERVWEGRAVSDATVASRIRSVRQVLGDDGRRQHYVRTVRGRGFRFVAAVQILPGETTRDPPVLAASTASAGVAVPAAQSRPALAVLAFHCPIGEPVQTLLAQAMAHELIVELSRLHWLAVTARGSSFRLSTADTSYADIGRLLGVRYCLSGALELQNQRLELRVELVDTRDARVVWADQFQGELHAVHALRETIRTRVLNALEIRIPLHEAAAASQLATEDLDAWSAYHRGLQQVYRFQRSGTAAAAALFQRAVTLDPGFARAYAGLSFVHFQSVFMHHSDDLAVETSLARRYAERGLELDPLDPFVNFAMGRSYWLVGELEAGLVWLERATQMSPNYAHGIYACAWSEALAGRSAAARSHVDQAMRLSPLDPLHYAMQGTRAFAHLGQGEDDEAAAWAQRAARSPGAHVFIAMIAAVLHALTGDERRARAWRDNVRARDPELRQEDFFRAFPIKPAAMRSRLTAGLTGLGF